MIYRFYQLNDGGRIIRPPETLDLSNDEAAVAHARLVLQGGAPGVEVWTGVRLVFREMLERR
jgi:hypothetical protein